MQQTPLPVQVSPLAHAQSPIQLLQFSPRPGWQVPSPQLGAVWHWLSVQANPAPQPQSMQQSALVSSPMQTPSPQLARAGGVKGSPSSGAATVSLSEAVSAWTSVGWTAGSVSEEQPPEKIQSGSRQRGTRCRRGRADTARMLADLDGAGAVRRGP